eukprot:424475-Alexandrium_andersonii.AAC.1
MNCGVPALAPAQLHCSRKACPHTLQQQRSGELNASESSRPSARPSRERFCGAHLQAECLRKFNC